MRKQLAMAALVVSVSACGISTQQEVQMGADYARQINAQIPLVNDPEINRYISVIGDSIARLADDRNLQWRFYVVDSREVNAFAVPGGFIYINRGLIARADNMSMLAGVLGHEIAHVTQRHSIEQMQRGQTANIGVVLACVLTSICEGQAGQAAIQVGGAAYFARHSRQAEEEADRYAVRYVTRAGIDPRGIPQMFRVLLDERQTRPAGVEAWFMTHPLAEDRIVATTQHIQAIDNVILQQLTRDSQNYQAFRRRLAALPPPPQAQR
jgi:beta-barrel assembly-enhancing protease